MEKLPNNWCIKTSELNDEMKKYFNDVTNRNLDFNMKYYGYYDDGYGICNHTGLNELSFDDIDFILISKEQFYNLVLKK